MSPQVTIIFTKLLTPTDITKRLAVPSKFLTSLPGFNGNHAVTVHVMYGTKMWQLECSVRKKGYRKPVFSGGLWRNFVIRNNFSAGDRITMYKVQDEDGARSHFMVEVERPAPSLNDHVLANVAIDTLVDRGTNIVYGDQAETPVLSQREFKFFGIADRGIRDQLDADGEACCKFISDQKFSSDSVLGPPSACVEELKLDLTL